MAIPPFLQSHRDAETSGIFTTEERSRSSVHPPRRLLIICGHEHETMKQRVVHLLQKYLLNPPIKLLFAIGVVLPGYALLETTGRKTGKPRRTPVGNGLVGKQFWIVTEDGQKAGYVRNIAGNPRVRLKLRDGLRARWYTGTAHLLSDDDARERQRWLANQVPASSSNAAAVRFFGTELLTVQVDLDS